MIYRTSVPGPPLSDFVACMWFGQDYIVPHALERVLPTGSMALIVNLYEDQTRTYDSTDITKCRTMSGTIVAGASSRFGIIDTAEQRSTVGVSFKPGGAFPFFKLPAGELQDADVSLESLWGGEARYLREQLLEAETPEARFAMLERALLHRVTKPLERHPAVGFAVESFQRRPHRAISGVTDQIGLSERRFIQVFADQVGLTPKLFCRVQRFQRVLRHIANAKDIDWTQIALRCGYFDQAHFNHDFRAFSGINPSCYLAKKTHFQNHVVLQD
jgi:AraC-like DNA-binding protein